MPTATTKSIDKRINRGVARLDARIPNWWKKINLHRFDFQTCNNCILGQLGEDDLFAGKKMLNIRGKLSQYGFDWTSEDGLAGVAYFQTRWRQIIIAKGKAANANS